MVRVLQLLNQNSPDTLIKEFKECSHPDPDIVCDNCNCWKVYPFGDKKDLDICEIVWYKESPFGGFHYLV